MDVLVYVGVGVETDGGFGQASFICFDELLEGLQEVSRIVLSMVMSRLLSYCSK